MINKRIQLEISIRIPYAQVYDVSVILLGTIGTCHNESRILIQRALVVGSFGYLTVHMRCKPNFKQSVPAREMTRPFYNVITVLVL